MMTNEAKVGAFTLGGAGLLAGMITFMGAFNLGGGGYELKVNYPQVGGLMPGQVVRYAGVQVGSVKKINVAPDKVEVIAKINDDIKIPQGATFSIASDGMMGEKFVNIIPPAKLGNGYLEPDSTVKGNNGGSMEDFFANSSDLMAKMENIADAFNNIFGDKEVQAAMQQGFKNMRDISENMAVFTKVVADVSVKNQSEINAMVQQMRALSEHMARTTAYMESMMKGIDNNGETGKNIASIAKNMADTTARMESIVAVLETVAKDPVTGQSLKETLVNVKETSAKANKILDTLTSAQVSLDAADSLKGDKWRGNIGVTFTPSKDKFLYMGAYDVGGKDKFDFVAGKKFGNVGLSAGAMQGDFGVGLSYDIGKSFKVYTQYYDFDDAKLRVGGEIKVQDNLSLYGETMDVKGSKKDTYVGVRANF